MIGDLRAIPGMQDAEAKQDGQRLRGLNIEDFLWMRAGILRQMASVLQAAGLDERPGTPVAIDETTGEPVAVAKPPPSNQTTDELVHLVGAYCALVRTVSPIYGVALPDKGEGGGTPRGTLDAAKKCPDTYRQISAMMVHATRVVIAGKPV